MQYVSVKMKQMILYQRFIHEPAFAGRQAERSDFLIPFGVFNRTNGTDFEHGMTSCDRLGQELQLDFPNRSLLEKLEVI